jgi:broad-specificity NMP kinase
MIIGITGHKRSGKSTVAAVLRNEYGFRCYSLAEPIMTGGEDEDDDSEDVALFDSWGDADRMALEQPLCSAYGYEVFEWPYDTEKEE